MILLLLAKMTPEGRHGIEENSGENRKGEGSREGLQREVSYPTFPIKWHDSFLFLLGMSYTMLIQFLKVNYDMFFTNLIYLLLILPNKEWGSISLSSFLSLHQTGPKSNG